jgi:hypothetical protein
MRKSVIIIVSIITIAIASIISTRPLPLLNNTPRFNAEPNGLSVALIKPTFTAAAYHASFYKFYFVHATIPLHARKNITSDLNLLSSPVYNLLTRS